MIERERERKMVNLREIDGLPICCLCVELLKMHGNGDEELGRKMTMEYDKCMNQIGQNVIYL